MARTYVLLVAYANGAITLSKMHKKHKTQTILFPIIDNGSWEEIDFGEGICIVSI